MLCYVNVLLKDYNMSLLTQGYKILNL
jgi:hypothetical protein